MISHDEHERATARGDQRRSDEPWALDARYDRQRERIVVHLSTGLEIAFAPRDAQGLENATAEDLAAIEISPSGFGLHFPRLDADLYLPGLLEGYLGSKRWMAARLGRTGGGPAPPPRPPPAAPTAGLAAARAKSRGMTANVRIGAASAGTLRPRWTPPAAFPRSRSLRGASCGPARRSPGWSPPTSSTRQAARPPEREVDLLREMLDAAEAQIRDLQRRLDAEAEERRALTQRLLGPPEPAPAAAPPARSWWRRWQR